LDEMTFAARIDSGRVVGQVPPVPMVYSAAPVRVNVSVVAYGIGKPSALHVSKM
jgi:hypothetical protein